MYNKIMLQRNKKGFSLVELIVVIAIIGILVMLAAPKFMGYTEKTRIKRIQNDVKVVEGKVMEEYIASDYQFDGNVPNADLEAMIGDKAIYGTEGKIDKGGIKEGNYKEVGNNLIKEARTKLKGKFYANADGKVYYVDDKTNNKKDKDIGKEDNKDEEVAVKEEDIDDLVDNEGVIPVANAIELNQIRQQDAKLTFGLGTKWEGIYTSGMDKDYVQVSDINLEDLSKVDNWKPLGDGMYESFTGSYDGSNLTIKNLNIENNQEDSFIGLFGFSEFGSFKNIKLINFKIEGPYNYVGALAGYSYGSHIENCYAEGSIKNANVSGGLVGISDGDEKMLNSSTNVNIIVDESAEVSNFEDYIYAGGLIGYSSQVEIDNCFSVNGSIKTLEIYKKDDSGESIYLGGLVGGLSGEIKNSYSTNSVSAEHHGIIGGLVGEGVGTIYNSYYNGDVGREIDYKNADMYTEKRTLIMGGLAGDYNGSIIQSHASGNVYGKSDESGLLIGFLGYGESLKIYDSYVDNTLSVIGYFNSPFIGCNNSILNTSVRNTANLGTSYTLTEEGYDKNNHIGINGVGLNGYDVFGEYVEEKEPSKCSKNNDFEFDTMLREITKYKGSDTDIIIPESIEIEGKCYTVKRIGEEAFTGMNINSVTFPDSIVEIKALAFAENNLTEVKIPEKISIIDAGAFMDNNISKIEFNEKLRNIEGYAFANNSLSNHIVFPDSVHSIGNYAFTSNSITSISVKLRHDELTWQPEIKIISDAFEGSVNIEYR